MTQELIITDFKGMRQDVGRKYCEPENLFNIQNFNYRNIIGAQKIKFPEQVNRTELVAGNSIDGIFEFKYLDQNNVLRSQDVIVTGGSIYVNTIETEIPILVNTGFLTAGYQCTFAVLNDKLFIANGIDYPVVYNGTLVKQMGAPYATVTTNAGGQNGNYYYAISYVTAGGDENIGTISNTVTSINKAISLELPIGYAGTLQRKIYRTSASGTMLRFLALIPDNTTLTYTDTTPDSGLGASIGFTNNSIPKVAFLEVSNFRLAGCVEQKYPTQLWVGDTFKELFDFASATDVSNIGNDNTPLVGMSVDYSQLVIGSESQMYLANTSQTAVSVIQSRSAVGVLNGYSMQDIPRFKDFPGGVAFLSSLGDVRIFSGNIALPVATSLDNLDTDSWSQPIKPALDAQIGSIANIGVAFYNFMYHLAINEVIFCLDIRKQAWTTINLETESYKTAVNCFGTVGGYLYLGMFEKSFVEKMYADRLYKGEVYNALLDSPDLLVSEDTKYYKDIKIYYAKAHNNNVHVRLIIENDEKNPIDFDMNMSGGDFDNSTFLSPEFNTQESDTYKVFHINRWGRWIRYLITAPETLAVIKSVRIVYDQTKNKEG